jgi:hypothetical protein
MERSKIFAYMMGKYRIFVCNLPECRTALEAG